MVHGNNSVNLREIMEMLQLVKLEIALSVPRPSPD